jgi:hypothetical protein
MLSLYEMTTKGDADNRQMADLLLRNVFYERETLDLLVELLKSYQVRARTHGWVGAACAGGWV